MKKVFIVWVVICVIVLAGCSSAKNNDSAKATAVQHVATPAPTPAPTPTASPSPSKQVLDTKFSLEELEISEWMSLEDYISTFDALLTSAAMVFVDANYYTPTHPVTMENLELTENSLLYVVAVDVKGADTYKYIYKEHEIYIYTDKNGTILGTMITLDSGGDASAEMFESQLMYQEAAESVAILLICGSEAATETARALNVKEDFEDYGTIGGITYVKSVNTETGQATLKLIITDVLDVLVSQNEE